MRKRNAFLFMMGDSRLCSHADGNDHVERKRGDKYKSKTHRAVTRVDEVQRRTIGVCM